MKFAHAWDLHSCLLRMFEDTFSFGAAHFKIHFYLKLLIGTRNVTFYIIPRE